MTRLPVLRALQTFSHVAPHPSFSAAAAELGMTHGAISHQIRLLERWLGQKVFERHRGGVRLTDAGRQLDLACRKAFAILEDEVDRLRDPGREATVAIGCSSTLLAHWLLPRIDAFARRRPDISLTFQTARDGAGLRARRIDVLITDAPVVAPGEIVSTRLTDDRIGPVCAPTWRPLPAAPADMASLPLLHASSRPNAWNEWAHAAATRVEVGMGEIFETLSLSLEAASGGLGFAMTPEFVARSAIEAGRLVAPLGFVKVARATWLCTRETDAANPTLRAFTTWLIDEASTA